MSTEPSDPAAEAPPGAGSSADPKARARMEAFRAVVALICGPPDAGEEAGPPLMRFSGQEAGFVTDEGGLHVLAVAGKGEPVVPWLEQLAARVGRGMVHRILVVQPEAELRATLEALSLRFPKGGSVALFVLDEDGQIWCSEDAELGPFLGRIGPDLLAQTVPPKAWAASLQAAKARGDDSRAEAERWRGPRPVSIGLLVVVVVVYEQCVVQRHGGLG